MDVVFSKINEILDIDQNLNGEDYLKVFVKNIAKILDMKYVLIAHPLDKSCEKVQTDVIWGGEGYIDNFIYDLKDTPCQIVLSGDRVCMHDCDVSILFPDDSILKDLKIEAYIGAPVARSDKDVSSILILMDIKPIDDKVFISSITEFLALRASAEIEKFCNEEKLLQEVHKQTKQLEVSNEKLQVSIHNLKNTQEQLVESEKMASLGGIVAGVAHDINTPVGIGITGVSHLVNITKEIEKKYNNNEMSQEEFEKYLKDSSALSKQVFENLDKTATLIQTFKQLAIDITNEDKTNFNLCGYLKSTLYNLNLILKETKITIDFECDESIEMYSHPIAFSQIFTNLVMNSIKHAFLKDEKGKISIRVFEKNNTLIITYEDDGCGISNENIERIFEPFFTTNRKENCSGLGLNILYNLIINNLNGSIDCKSEENKGVLFTVKVPL